MENSGVNIFIGILDKMASSQLNYEVRFREKM